MMLLIYLPFIVTPQEVDEPGPNFIVVYDLQSGTLFKKWKPGMNCVALDISSKDGCVLSGHENGHICIWDLTTGNCRWTLDGHVAPVTSLRLDPMGGTFVSLDTHARDRTIKLWSVTTGECSDHRIINRDFISFLTH